MYTPEQTAEMLKIATSTLRKYSKLYSAHLSPAANRKQRKYTEGDIAILGDIVRLRAEGVSLGDIPAHLVTVQPEEVKPDNSLALIPAIAQEFQSLHDQLAQVQAHQDEQIAALRAEIEALKAEQEKPWYRKLFKPK